jgi:membrane protein involved in colicin uptake
MQKSIKRYICIAAILSTMIGYAQKAEELETVIVTIRSSNKSEAEKQAEIASLQAILNGMYERARAEAEAAAKAKALADAEAAAKAKAEAEAGGSGTPLKEVVVINTTQIWYFDNDGDGYFGATKQSSTSPGALWRTSKGAGSDCNDNDATKTNNCTADLPKTTWFWTWMAMVIMAVGKWQQPVPALDGQPP